MTTWSSDDFAAWRMGEAIKAACLAEGGWMDWTADGKVRFLNRDKDGNVGVHFSEWIKDGMRVNRDKIKRYVELVRENDERYKSRG